MDFQKHFPTARLLDFLKDSIQHVYQDQHVYLDYTFIRNTRVSKRMKKLTFSSGCRGELGTPNVEDVTGDCAAEPHVPKSSLFIEIGECARVRLSSAAASPKIAFCCCLLFSFFFLLFRRTLCTSNSIL